MDGYDTYTIEMITPAGNRLRMTADDTWCYIDTPSQITWWATADFWEATRRAAYHNGCIRKHNPNAKTKVIVGDFA